MYAPGIEQTCETERRRAGDLVADPRPLAAAAREFLADPVGRKRRLADKMVRLLDRAAPLKGASHADVESYGVDIPLRYASLFALLRDGRKVRLRDARDFAGWSGWTGRRSFLIRNGGQYVEIVTDRDHPQSTAAPGGIRDLVFDPSGRYIALDGSQLVLPA